jgi:cytochrome b6-f complex iron-sulfur subunit
MPLIDDLKMPIEDAEHNRRVFLGMLGGTALAVAGLGTGAVAVRFLWPEVLFEQESRFRIGRPEEIPQDTLLVLPEQRAFVVHARDGFFALSATCTHLGCLTRYEAEHKRIFCPCHGSQFDTTGKVTNGPAPRALPRLALLLEDGDLVLDVSTVVEGDALLRV